MSIIEFKDFSFKYKGREEFSLKNINLNIDKGDFVGIIGSSGAGKTSFSYAMNSVIPHYFTGDFYGEVKIDGKDTVDSEVEDISKIVGSVFQDIDGQMLSAVVEDELLFGLENFGIDKKEIPERMEKALKDVGISELRHRTINSLSGGQKQKVAIASILALRPSVLVLDEPTGELDPHSSVQIFKLLKSLNEDFGITVIVIEQKIMLLCEFVKKLMVIDHGEVKEFDETKKVLENHKELKKIGVNVAPIVSLANILKEKNLYNGEIPLNLEDAEKMVRSVLNDKI